MRSSKCYPYSQSGNDTDTLSSSQPAYLCCLLDYHIPAHSLHSSSTSLLSVLQVCTTFASRGLSLELTPIWHLHLLIITYVPSSS